jgi:hypothetical protein
MGALNVEREADQAECSGNDELLVGEARGMAAGPER